MKQRRTSCAPKGNETWSVSRISRWTDLKIEVNGIKLGNYNLLRDGITIFPDVFDDENVRSEANNTGYEEECNTYDGAFLE